MVELVKGANTPIAATAVHASLRWSNTAGVPDVDLCGLSLNESGKVADDADFVFYNQPDHPSGAIRLDAKSTGAHASQGIDVDLGRLPSTVDRVLLVAASDGGVFADVPQLHVVVLDRQSRTELVRFSMSAEAETALIVGELYRRDHGWKFRAVGQGYHAGLAGLAVDFGVHVADQATDQPAADQPAAHRASAEAGHVVPTGGRRPVQLTGDATTEVLASLQLGPVAASDARPPELSALAFDRAGGLVDMVWFLHPSDFAGSLAATVAPAARGDASTVPAVALQLSGLPAQVQHVALTATSARRTPLREFVGLSLQLTDATTGRALDSTAINAPQQACSAIVAVLSRSGADSWQLERVQQFGDEQTGRDLVNASSTIVQALPAR